MSNIHKVKVQGWMPYDCGRGPAMRYLALMAGPSWGLSVTYGQQILVPNEHKGQTTYYAFEIKGEEGMWESGIEAMLEALIKERCVITLARAEDIEFPVPEHTVKFQNDPAVAEAVLAVAKPKYVLPK